MNKPTLVLAHNKTLAGQLYSELKEFFPEIELNILFELRFLSTGKLEHTFLGEYLYIDKNAKTNYEIEMLRSAAMNSLDRTGRCHCCCFSCFNLWIRKS